MSGPQNPMHLRTTTSTALLEGLKDAANQTVWAEYVGRYRPLLVAWCRRVGLPHTDAEDVAQDALLEFAAGYRAGRYDPDRGRLRGWLYGIAHNTLRRWRQYKSRRGAGLAAPGAAADALAQIADEDRLGALWEEEWRRAILRRCLEEVALDVAPQTMAAFDLFACQGLPAAAVAARLCITENAVFIAKHRVLRRMREIQVQLNDTW